MRSGGKPGRGGELGLSGWHGLRVTVLVGAWLVLLVGFAHALAPRIVDAENLDQIVAPGSPTTYFDLLKLVFPDLKKPEGKGFEAVAGETVPVRHIDREYEKQPLSGTLKFIVISSLPIKADNQPLLLVHVDVTRETPEESGSQVEEYSLLALFQTGTSPKLLDLVDIKADRFNGFLEERPLLNLTPGRQACLIYHHHFNSNQSYNIIRLLFVRNQRLQEILSVAPFSVTSWCETFGSQAAFRVVPDQPRLYPKVVATVTLKRKKDPPDCQPQRSGFTRTYRGIWQWDSKKQEYSQVSGNLDRLYKWYDQYY
jgi:hypothetical protein